MSDRRLADMLDSAARGQFPPPNGAVELLGAPPGRLSAVVAFTAHSVIAADVSREEVAARLPAGDLGAPMSAPFLTWLGQQLGAEPGVLDAVLVHHGSGGAMARPIELVPRPDLTAHPRVARALRQRDQVAVYTDPDGRGVLTLGRGLAGRREVSLEIDPAWRGAGLGRRLIDAARSLVPPGEPLFAQVSPGNAASLRAFLAAGFRPIGAEVLFHTG